MRVIPNPTLLRNVLFYAKMFGGFLILWIVLRIMVVILTIVGLILAIKYAAYIPDNQNYRRNYEDTKVAPSNPFTSPPKTYTPEKE